VTQPPEHPPDQEKNDCTCEPQRPPGKSWEAHQPGCPLREHTLEQEQAREIAEEIRDEVVGRTMEVQRARMWGRDAGEWTRYERELSRAYLALASEDEHLREALTRVASGLFPKCDAVEVARQALAASLFAVRYSPRGGGVSLSTWPRPAWYGIGVFLGTLLGIDIGWLLTSTGVLPNG
jgi:hypothetical protein